VKVTTGVQWGGGGGGGEGSFEGVYVHQRRVVEKIQNNPKTSPPGVRWLGGRGGRGEMGGKRGLVGGGRVGLGRRGAAGSLGFWDEERQKQSWGG